MIFPVRLASIAVIGGAAISSPVAAHEIVLSLPDFQLAGGQSVTFDFDVEMDKEGGHVTHFYFVGDYENIAADGSWASDLQFTTLTPAGQSVVIGGFDHLDDADLTWGFQGSQSANDGQYLTLFAHPFDPEPEPEGAWSFTFTNDRLAGGMHSWTDVEVWLIPTTIPGPGALPLMGLLVVCGSRRRRRLRQSTA